MAHASLLNTAPHSSGRALKNTRSIWGWISAMTRLRHERVKLAQLSDVQLRDIGLSREDARREAGRAAWDAPTHWHG